MKIQLMTYFMIFMPVHVKNQFTFWMWITSMLSCSLVFKRGLLELTILLSFRYRSARIVLRLKPGEALVLNNNLARIGLEGNSVALYGRFNNCNTRPWMLSILFTCNVMQYIVVNIVHLQCDAIHCGQYCSLAMWCDTLWSILFTFAMWCDTFSSDARHQRDWNERMFALNYTYRNNWAVQIKKINQQSKSNINYQSEIQSNIEFVNKLKINACEYLSLNKKKV